MESAVAMQKLAASVAAKIAAAPVGRAATVIALSGDLGAGKTTFTQGFLKALGVRRRIISPTFLIVRPYSLPATRNDFTRAFHIDCYRLQRPTELLALGLKDILRNPRHVVLVEWPELIREYLPKDAVRIEIEHPKSGTARRVSVS